jgi:hypothetical protein
MVADHWQEDLLFLAEEIRRRHANPFHQISPEQLDASVDSLLRRIPLLARHQIIVEMAKIIAMIGDGHTTFWLTFNKSLKFHKYPLRFYEFSDGVFVYETTSEHRKYLGARLIGIGAYPVEDALRKVESVVPRDNAMGLKLGAAHTLSIPEVLHTVGIIDALDTAEFMFEDAEGKVHKVQLPLLEPDSEHRWTRLYENKTPLALWQRNPERFYWFEYLEQHQLVYVQHRAVQNMDDEPIEAFCRRLFNFIEAHSVERLVIDVRSSSGAITRSTNRWYMG